MNKLELELSWESAGYFLNEGKVPLFGPFATEFLAMDFLRQINEVLERVELEKWRDDEPDDEDMYLVAWKGSLKDGDIWPAENHYYALVMWYSDTGWDYNAFPDFYSKVDIIAWQKLPPYFEGKL
jgi:hypothetical protein